MQQFKQSATARLSGVCTAHLSYAHTHPHTRAWVTDDQQVTSKCQDVSAAKLNRSFLSSASAPVSCCDALTGPDFAVCCEKRQSGVCTDDEDCGGDEFCNDARGACLPCRKSRKRCARDSMCCAGNRCSNGVCQANDIDSTDASIITGWHKHNNTMEHQAKKPPTAHGHQPHAVKGQEGDTCLRSADCSEGLCCARHFWSRICKPVLTEGQVCTRHRRKGTHGLELFQRCDCGDGLACRPEKGERDHSVSRTAARNLHTCQRR